MKFGQFKFGIEKFGTYTTPGASVASGVYLSGAGASNRFDVLILPVSGKSVVVDHTMDTDKRESVIAAVKSAGGKHFMGVG